MTDPFILMLRDWQNFYILVGTASATLTGLTFIAASLGTGLIPVDPTNSVHTWATPLISHFVAVLLISIVMAVPTITVLPLSVLLGLGGLVGLRYVVVIGLRLRQQTKLQKIELVDTVWNVVLPSLAYLFILITAVGLLLNVTQILNGLVVSVTVLLVASIRNTWDLIIWIAQNPKP